VLALWDNIEIRLGFAPQMLGGQLYLHRLDLERILQPLATSQPSLSPAGPHLIVIDPGHGGENAGTRSSVTSRYEKVYTLDWARRLGTLLLSNGWQVVLTRSNDRDLALSNRVTMAEFNKADLFISLHFNSAPHDAQQAGLETYYLTPVGMPSTVTRGFLDDASLSFPNNSFDDQNLLWAMRLHRTLVRATGRRDRGVRHARFLGVLRNQRRPAVLIEGGYLSNPQEARLIDQPAYRQQLAEAVAAALGAPGSL
jgi:N-acetylmuramoyl-L-alanine amidase